MYLDALTATTVAEKCVPFYIPITKLLKAQDKLCALIYIRICTLSIIGYNILFRVSTLAKPQCDKVWQRDPRTVSAEAHYCTKALQTLTTEKNVISSLLYTFLASTRLSDNDTITEQRFEITGRGFQSRKCIPAECFDPI